MENASKALLIAAAVLIVILLIAFGMRIFNSTGDTSGQAEDLSASQQMQAFNAQFTGYLGTNRNASTVRNLQAIVNSSNTRNTQHQVTITLPSGGVKDGSVYTVEATYDSTTSYITAISVK